MTGVATPSKRFRAVPSAICGIPGGSKHKSKTAEFCRFQALPSASKRFQAISPLKPPSARIARARALRLRLRSLAGKFRRDVGSEKAPALVVDTKAGPHFAEIVAGDGGDALETP